MRGGPQDGEGCSLGTTVSDAVSHSFPPPPWGGSMRAWAEKKEREVIRGAGGEGEADGGGVGCTGGFGD